MVDYVLLHVFQPIETTNSKMASRESPIEVYNNMWCDECDKEVEPNEKAYHCRTCEDFDICENCHLHGSKHVDPSHTFQIVTFKGAPSG